MKLKIGDKAPNIISKLEDNSDFELYTVKSEFIVLYFYPKDLTPGCTIQACGLRDNISVFNDLGAKIYGIGKGDDKSHEKFKNKHKLNFPLILDTSLDISKKFYVTKEKSMFGKKYLSISRTTFILDQNFIILEIMENVHPLNHTENLKRKLKNLK